MYNPEYNSEETPPERNTPSPVPSLRLSELAAVTLPTEDISQPPLGRRGFVADSHDIPLLPIASTTRQDSFAPLLRRDPAEKSSTTSADANNAASEGDEDTQDDLSTNPFDDRSTEDEQAIIFPDQPFPLDAGTSSSTSPAEPLQPMSVTAFMQACMRFIEDVNKALDNPESELSSIFPRGIETRRTFLKTALSLVANWRTYKKVSQRDIFFESEFDIKDSHLMEYIQAFNSALFGLETGKYGLIRSVYLVKIIRLLMDISKDSYAHDGNKQNEIKHKLINAIAVFSESSTNDAYQSDLLMNLFGEYLSAEANVLFVRYRNNMILADQQLRAAAILIEYFPYRMIVDAPIKQAMLDAFKAGLFKALELVTDYELAVALDRKLTAITRPTSALAIEERYQSYWVALRQWSANLNRLDDDSKRLVSLMRLINNTDKHGVMYITNSLLQQIGAAQRNQDLTQPFDEQLLQQTNNESAQFMSQFLDPQQLNQADFERYLGVIDAKITDFDGHALSSNQVSNPHLEAKKTSAMVQPICSSSSSSSSPISRDNSNAGFFGRLFRNKSASPKPPAKSGMVTATSSPSSVPKLPADSLSSSSSDGVLTRTENPLYGRTLPKR